MKTYKLATCLFLLVPLSLLANSNTDKQIEDTAKASYNYRKILDNNVKVKVDGGVATLSGKVDSEEQRRIAEDTVSDIPGVVRVNNLVKVDNDGKEVREGSDAWIASKARGRLLVKSNVSLTKTKVDVLNGVVTLTGTAKTQAQKELTEAYIKDIDGVQSVRNEIIVADPSTDYAQTPNGRTADRRDDRVGQPTGRDETIGEKIDDSSITAQVKYELFSHKSTSALKTKVNTHNGNVIISGDASSDAEKDLVTKLAKSVRGVSSVDNNMKVRN